MSLRGSESDDVHLWLHRWQVKKQLCRWSDVEAVQHASLNLGPVPYGWFATHAANFNTWADFATGMQERFADDKQALMLKLRNRRQQHDESVQAYADALTVLFARTNTPAGSQCNLFLDNCRPHAPAEKASSCQDIDSCPDSLQTAIKRAVFLEACDVKQSPQHVRPLQEPLNKHNPDSVSKVCKAMQGLISVLAPSETGAEQSRYAGPVCGGNGNYRPFALKKFSPCQPHETGSVTGAQLMADAYWSEVTAQDELPLYESSKCVQATGRYSDLSCAGQSRSRMQPRYSRGEGQLVIYQVAHVSLPEPVAPCETGYYRQYQHVSRVGSLVDGEAGRQYLAGDKKTRVQQSTVAGHMKGVAKCIAMQQSSACAGTPNACRPTVAAGISERAADLSSCAGACADVKQCNMADLCLAPKKQTRPTESLIASEELVDNVTIAEDQAQDKLLRTEPKPVLPLGIVSVQTVREPPQQQEQSELRLSDELPLQVELAVSDAYPATLQVMSKTMAADAAAELDIKTTVVDSSKTGTASPMQVERPSVLEDCSVEGQVSAALVCKPSQADSDSLVLGPLVMLALLACAVSSLRSTQCTGSPSYCDLAGRSVHCLVLCSRGAGNFAGSRLCWDPGIGMYTLQDFAGWRHMLQEKVSMEQVQ